MNVCTCIKYNVEFNKAGFLLAFLVNSHAVVLLRCAYFLLHSKFLPVEYQLPTTYQTKCLFLHIDRCMDFMTYDDGCLLEME